MKDRVISGALMIAAMLLCMFLSPVTRVLFLSLAALLCAHEYCARLKENGIRCAFPMMVFLIVGQTVFALRHEKAETWALLFLAIAVLTLIAAIRSQRIGGVGAVYTLSGLVYPGLFFGAVMYIGASEIWLKAFALACLSTWVCDSAAMLGGKRFGKRKLAPLISPNKTVEGAACGAASSILVGLVVWLLGLAVPALSGIPLWLCVVTCLISSTMGQLGDLAESMLKRMIGIKDFSNLIPGHGGMFDRADSLLFSIPTAWLCLTLAGA